MDNEDILSNKDTIMGFVSKLYPAYTNIFEQAYAHYRKQKLSIFDWIILKSVKKSMLFQLN